MSTTEVVLLAKPDCANCEQVRSALERAHHDYRHVVVKEMNPDEPEGEVLATKHGVLVLPALIVDGRLRLVGEIPERDIRREIEKAKHGCHY